MVQLENIKLAISNVRSNWLRTVLTMLIIAFGIMALVGILTAIDSILVSMTNSFSGLGANSFAIVRKGDSFRRNDGRRREKVGDVVTYQQAIDLVERFKFPGTISIDGSGAYNQTVIFESKKTDPNVSVIGVNQGYLEVNGMEIEAGRTFSANEFKYGSNVCIIGSIILDDLFNGNADVAIDKIISVGGKKFRVVGVKKSKGASMTSNTDRQIEIPLLTQKKFYSYTGMNYNISIAVPSAIDMNDVTAYTIGLFRQIRNLKVYEPDDFEIEKSDAIQSIIEENTVTLRLATIGIGLITLLGAAIGLMNIMLVSVTERTREIGIRKALGATKKNIMIQFLTEAIIICQIGGIIGILLGMVAGNGVSLFTGSPFIIPWGWILMGIVSCLVVGLVSGLYPAMKAARLDPVESLRYE